mgnify:CR=1 FL=1
MQELKILEGLMLDDKANSIFNGFCYLSKLG